MFRGIPKKDRLRPVTRSADTALNNSSWASAGFISSQRWYFPDDFDWGHFLAVGGGGGGGGGGIQHSSVYTLSAGGGAAGGTTQIFLDGAGLYVSAPGGPGGGAGGNGHDLDIITNQFTNPRVKSNAGFYGINGAWGNGGYGGIGGSEDYSAILSSNYPYRIAAQSGQHGNGGMPIEGYGVGGGGGGGYAGSGSYNDALGGNGGHGGHGFQARGFYGLEQENNRQYGKFIDIIIGGGGAGGSAATTTGGPTPQTAGGGGSGNQGLVLVYYKKRKKIWSLR